MKPAVWRATTLPKTKPTKSSAHKVCVVVSSGSPWVITPLKQDWDHAEFHFCIQISPRHTTTSVVTLGYTMLYLTNSELLVFSSKRRPNQADETHTGAESFTHLFTRDERPRRSSDDGWPEFRCKGRTWDANLISGALPSHLDRPSSDRLAMGSSMEN